MSRSPSSDWSPIDGSGDEKHRAYADAWLTMNKLLREGRSLSGHERNCCFLNVRGPRFADVSATSGFDLRDDARTVALVDWDFDGDLDVWTANQTAPRVRFLRNERRDSNHFLALRLTGVTCNRDAIGARVELYLKGAKKPSRIKTLRAGEGFLGQSSKWIHFGIAEGETLERLVVHWPGGKGQTFAELRVDRFFTLVQDDANAKPFEPLKPLKPLLPSTPQIPKLSDAARIVEPGRPTLPDFKYRDTGGKKQAVSKHAGKPLLISLWSSSCRPCLSELLALTQREAAIRDAKIDVLALNVDSLAKDAADTSPQQVLQRIDYPFRSGRATHETVDTLDVVQRAILSMERPLRLPASFLLDSQQRVVVVYLGKLQIDQLIEDVRLLDAKAEGLRDAAAVRLGRWNTDPYTAQPVMTAITNRMIEGGLLDMADRYIIQIGARDADLLSRLAAAVADEGRIDDAIKRQQQVVKIVAPGAKAEHRRRLEQYRAAARRKAN